jgi:glycosyltransferase involved in cell wall biosynthesis
MAFISVIIPVFNREAYLREALDSVLKQTRPADEIIVVDDGSTDRSAEVAHSYGGCVRYVFQANQGIGGARNTGIAIARGDLIALLDSDDLWLETKLERQCDALSQHPEFDFVFCQMIQFSKPEVSQDEQPAFNHEAMAACLASGLLARREVFTKTGPYETDLRVGEFVSWIGRAQELGLRYDILPEVLLHRRVHAGNSVRDKTAKIDYVRLLKRQLDRRRSASE